MTDSVRKTITPTEWDAVVNQRIQTIRKEWDTLPVDDRFWIVFNWLKEYQIFDPAKAKRQLLVVKPYWLEV